MGLVVLFLVPLVLRRGWGPDAQVVRAILVAFMVDGLFLDIFGNRKQVWLFIGIAAGLAYLARRAESGHEVTDAATAPVAAGARHALDRDPPGHPSRRPGATVSPGPMPRANP